MSFWLSFAVLFLVCSFGFFTGLPLTVCGFCWFVKLCVQACSSGFGLMQFSGLLISSSFSWCNDEIKKVLFLLCNLKLLYRWIGECFGGKMGEI